MQTVLHRADTRGYADHGWLKSYHSFSFSSYQNPERMRFGLLRVLNDDLVAAGMGFGTHPHDNMEIVSIPLSGALRHRDSTGREAVIHSGDVQIMSAGRGLSHSEMNASGELPVAFLQVWVYPEQRDIAPRYDQKTFRAEDRQDRLQLVVAPEGAEGAVEINQQARFYLSELSTGTTLDIPLSQPGQGLYLFLIEGALEAAGQLLGRRDGLGIWELETPSLRVRSTEPSQLLVIEVPMETTTR